jgi:hypothetical protein
MGEGSRLHRAGPRSREGCRSDRPRDAHLRERFPGLAGAVGSLGYAMNERCSAISRVCCSMPDALAAKRNSCKASTPTPILSARQSCPEARQRAFRAQQVLDG